MSQRTGETSLLITPRELADWLRASRPPVVVDCQASLSDPAAGHRAWMAAHLPGAAHADLQTDLSAPRDAETGRHPLPDPEVFAQSARVWGVDKERSVVVYDDSNATFAVRCWWLFRWLGHPDVRVLDGGLSAWRRAGLSVESGGVAAGKGEFEPAPAAMPTVSADSLQTGLESGELMLLDARAEARFRGREEPIDPVAGHVPGARNAPFAGNVDENGHWRSPEQLQQRFRELLGAVNPRTVVHMCGSGVTACHNLFAMELAGLEGSALYPGSWSEWIRDSRRPVARDEG